MDLNIAKKIVAAAKKTWDSEDIYLMEDYSGRGMYGTTVVGLVCEDTASVAFHINRDSSLTTEEKLECCLALLKAKKDSMGCSIILY